MNFQCRCNNEVLATTAITMRFASGCGGCAHGRSSKLPVHQGPMLSFHTASSKSQTDNNLRTIAGFPPARSFDATGNMWCLTAYYSGIRRNSDNQRCVTRITVLCASSVSRRSQRVPDHIMGMGNPNVVCGPLLAVAVRNVAETVTQAHIYPCRVISRMRLLIKNQS